ncbi:hypothetical protein GCM10027445_42380 [Amycolatopsis endophytica]|uniref:Uncharacterized protein n=1 Tax=Amycolatopsis endophytica TaxID=860233 RepID=A0A853B6E8_9PSEU|nr:hypothetical protein [Amycolatopsis endophytica]NYI90649.1 hypothetical protein [Amycolatopsis endophytica]
MGWIVGVVLNAGLGVLAVWPVGFLVTLGWAVLDRLGWASIDPALVDDGLTPIVMLAAGSWIILLPLFLGLNVLVIRKSRVDGRIHWPMAVVLLVVPFLVRSA